MTRRAGVWRAPGLIDLAGLSVFGFSGYSALLAAAPLWAVEGGASAAGAGLVNGVLLVVTVLTQLGVPRAVVRWGVGRVLVAGLLLMGLPSPLYLVSADLVWVLGLSGVRGVGFGILTVIGSTVVAQLVPPDRRGAAIGAYGLAVAVPNLVLLPGSVPIVERWGFGPIFWLGALPLLGVPSAVRLTRVLRRVAPPGADQAQSEPASRPDLRSLRGIVSPTVVLFSVTMAGGALFTFAPQLTDPGTAALMLLIMGLSAALSRWLVGGLADRRGARPFIAPVLGLAAATLALSAWAVANERGLVLIAATTVFGLCYGGLQNLTLLVAFAAVEPPQLPSASAGWNIGFDAGTAAGSVLAGALATTYSFPVALATMAVLCLLVSVRSALSRTRH